MLAAEVTFSALNEGVDMDTYWDSLRNSWIWEELHKSRNYRPVSEAIRCHFRFYFLFCLSLTSLVKVTEKFHFMVIFSFIWKP